MPTTFDTLKRERAFRNPSDKEFQTPSLQKVTAPHLESFNSILEYGDDQRGLLDMAIADIGHKAVFDAKGGDGELGNKLSCIL